MQPREEAYVVFRIDAPRDLTRVEYGGRLYNRAPRSRIDFLHSFDGGKTWTQSYSLTNTAQPWDVIHYETRRGRSARHALGLGSSTGCRARLRARTPAVFTRCGWRRTTSRPSPRFKPLEVTFNWSERQADYSLVERSHTEVVTKLPHRYVINVGGADHPVMNSLRIRAREEMRGGQARVIRTAATSAARSSCRAG